MRRKGGMVDRHKTEVDVMEHVIGGARADRSSRVMAVASDRPSRPRRNQLDKDKPKKR